MGGEWPGWEKDEAIAADYSERIRRRMIRGAGTEAMVKRWMSIHWIPQRLPMPGEAESFLMTHAGARITEILGSLLESLWQDAWVLGAGCAGRLAAEAAGPEALKSAGRTSVTCDAGHEHHGAYGAAGLLIRHHSGSQFRYLLHQLARGENIGSWNLPGGQLHYGESAIDGAIREAREELGPLPGDLRLHHVVTDDHGNWNYSTFVMDASRPFRPSVTGRTPEETAGWGWLTHPEMRGMKLHPAFAATWDTVRKSDADTWVNTAMSVAKARRRNPMRGHPGYRPAELPKDQWAVVRGRLIAQGIPAPMAGVLSSAYETFLQSAAATALQGIISTIAGLIGPVLLEARENVITRDEAIHAITEILDDEYRAMRIAITEVTRASAAAAQQVHVISQVQMVRWVTARDAKVCVACRKNARAGAIPLGDQFPSGLIAPPQHPNCLPGSVRVRASDVVASSDRHYTGDLIIIRTALGYELSATPNHPVATRSGWVPVSELKVGDYVLSSTHGEWELDRADPDVDEIPPFIEDVAHALQVRLSPVPVSPEDFHGDGTGSEICVIRADGLLVGNRNSASTKHLSQNQFSSRDIGSVSTTALVTGSPANLDLRGLELASDSGMRGFSEPESLLGGSSTHADVHGLTPVTDGDISFSENTPDRLAVDREGFCERLSTLSSEVTPDKVVGVRRVAFSGHVYNLETADGWYISSGIVTHNCRCAVIPVATVDKPQGLSDIMKRAGNPWYQPGLPAFS